ncbi:MAG: hypothetical protein QM757_08250, partial [Paludibaculum sp.]
MAKKSRSSPTCRPATVGGAGDQTTGSVVQAVPRLGQPVVVEHGVKIQLRARMPDQVLFGFYRVSLLTLAIR